MNESNKSADGNAIEAEQHNKLESAKALSADVHELRIEIWAGLAARYEGTRAQLEAEGVIPEGTVWPTGTNRVSWESAGCGFVLRRCRAPGIRGPKKIWSDGDWWCLDIDDCMGHDGIVQREITRRTRELERFKYLQTARGGAEFKEQYSRFLKARHDKRFQAFKALIPALAPRRGARKAT
ncbi:hypothetical protein EOS_31565 [Caballeronia mineralivorans PML1(12)]|uniref:Uncharacterized protein n=1 Tax=Caballeronia mineralivorans PML1(12) TaxID=908627 RepID=A0A0J1CPH0_9BURK|nr:hypothetical protein [Caballeronia mineralivorans]KLU22236.1 hypothetical protein EOS_31565 [Caballeronia mineralivorans PML1(12)]